MTTIPFFPPQGVPAINERTPEYVPATVDAALPQAKEEDARWGWQSDQRRPIHNIEVRQVSVYSTSPGAGPKGVITGDCMTQRICCQRQQMSLTQQILYCPKRPQTGIRLV